MSVFYDKPESESVDEKSTDGSVTKRKSLNKYDIGMPGEFRRLSKIDSEKAVGMLEFSKMMESVTVADTTQKVDGSDPISSVPSADGNPSSVSPVQVRQRSRTIPKEQKPLRKCDDRVHSQYDEKIGESIEEQKQNTREMNLYQTVVDTKLQLTAKIAELEKVQEELGMEKAVSKQALAKLNAGSIKPGIDYKRKFEDEHVRSMHLQQQLDQKEQQILALQQTLLELQQQRASKVVAQDTALFWQVTRNEIEINEDKILGRGGWGYVAEGRFRGTRVAIKCIHSDILLPHTVDRVEREINTMARLRHPNLILFIAAVLEDKAGPIIITEILTKSLRKAYEDGNLQLRIQKIIFRDVACALHYLHSQTDAIIHRDVSSANVLLEPMVDGLWRAKLSDFGSANLVRLATTLGDGALVYTAPEAMPQSAVSQTKPPPLTPKVDIFSYGVMATEVITSRFPDSGQFEKMLLQVESSWPDFHKLVCLCTQYTASARPTMADVILKLDQL